MIGIEEGRAQSLGYTSCSPELGTGFFALMMAIMQVIACLSNQTVCKINGHRKARKPANKRADARVSFSLSLYTCLWLSRCKHFSWPSNMCLDSQTTWSVEREALSGLQRA